MSNIQPSRPTASEYAADFDKYVGLPPEGDLQSFLAKQLDKLLGLLAGMSEPESLVRHAPYTWSIKQVVGHLIDCERIFGYRALRIARNDATPLASFDENAYMPFADFDHWPIAELLAEFDHVRRSHLLFFRHLEPAAWLRQGIVLNQPMTVRALAYVIAGHAKHHLDILHRRLTR